MVIDLRLQFETTLIQHFYKLYLDLVDNNKKDIQLVFLFKHFFASTNT